MQVAEPLDNGHPEVCFESWEVTSVGIVPRENEAG